MRIKKFAAIWATIYALSVVISFGMAVDKDDVRITESDLGVMCVQAVYPATRGSSRTENKGGLLLGDGSGNIDRGSANSGSEILGTDGNSGTSARQQGADDGSGSLEDGSSGTGKSLETQIIDTQDPNSPTPATPNAQKGKPLVLIYHTHATEAYQPLDEGNYRTLEEEGSVRDVGNILAEELEKMGIEVIHDKTLHDAESYNQSYSKSLATAKKQLADNPSIVFVIDLHRDAAAYMGGGKTVTVNGETAATYSLVVGQGNENAASLNIFADTINKKAEEMYPGFGGRIISKEYKYNQYVSDYHILLEVGNNENHIKESRVTAKYFAQVFKAVIDDIT